MFPQLRQRIGPALDLLVEFSTLGEYRMDTEGVLRPASAFAHASECAPQLGGAGDSVAGRAAVRRIVAGGAAGLAPAATPAARRLGRAEAAQVLARRPEPEGDTARSLARTKPRPHAGRAQIARPHVAPAGEQLCLAI
jgi:hypothetical protein